MRIMPFMKRKKGVQFAGIGLETGGGGGGSLPIASAETLGGVKIGNNLSITAEGVLSASGGADFSTSEVDTGRKWVDNKAIYRKVLISNDVTYGSLPTISNVDTVVSFQAMATNSAHNTNYVLPALFSSSNFFYVYPYKPSGTNVLNFGGFGSLQMSGGYLVAIVEYTKTN